MSYLMNSLWPRDASWWNRSGTTLAQVMVCCLTATSHYLDQCWIIISSAQVPHLYKNTSAINHWNKLENHLLDFHSNLRGQFIKTTKMTCIYGHPSSYRCPGFTDNGASPAALLTMNVNQISAASPRGFSLPTSGTISCTNYLHSCYCRGIY